MKELFEMGLTESDLKQIIELNPMFKELSDYEINNKIKILKFIKCSDKSICNIITYNPIFLNLDDNKIIELFGYLMHKGFNSLNILIDSNPNILNLSINDIDRYINNRINNNESLEEIIDDLDSFPILFDEM